MKVENITREKEKQTDEIFRQVHDDTRDTLKQVFVHANDRARQDKSRNLVDYYKRKEAQK